jgi:hypothetical protein
MFRVSSSCAELLLSSIDPRTLTVDICGDLSKVSAVESIPVVKEFVISTHSFCDRILIHILENIAPMSSLWSPREVICGCQGLL